MPSYYLTSVRVDVISRFRDDESVSNWCKDFNSIIPGIFPSQDLHFKTDEYAFELEVQLSGNFNEIPQLNIYIIAEEIVIEQLKVNEELQHKLLRHLERIINKANEGLAKERVAKIPDADSIYKDHRFYSDTSEIEALGGLHYHIVQLKDALPIDWKYLDD